ncbi:MAG: HAMP domain-containing histidine kinase [Clostridia bacterium]|nr:HAMP domain-containing histidine kinase [Clostridia bacterium]
MVSKQLDDEKNALITTQLKGDVFEDVVHKINVMKENEHKTKVEINKEQAALKQAIADISHDIRTPLTSVVGYLQLAEKSAENEEQRADIEIALERAKYCSTLVNDFFELSVIDSKGIDPVMESVDVNDILCELILANFPNFEAKGITPRFEDSGNPVYARADKKMLTRVIQNLISNGIKYSSDRLEISLEETKNAVKISLTNPISDYDIDVEKIFDKFYQSGKARTANGAGIGLYVCRQFVMAMDGMIYASLENGLLTVTVTLDMVH